MSAAAYNLPTAAVADASEEQLSEMEHLVMSVGGWAAAGALATLNMLGVSSEIRTIGATLILVLAGAMALAARRLGKYAIRIAELSLRRRLRKVAAEVGLSEEEIANIEKEIER